MSAYLNRFVPLFEEYGGATLSTQAMNASGVAVAGIFKCEKAGTIDRIESWVTAITGTCPTYDARLESLSAAFPSNSLIAANTNLAWQPSGTGMQSQTLTASRVVAVNDLLAAVIRYSSGTIDGSNFATFRSRCSGAVSGGGQTPWFPRAVLNTGGGWAVATTFPTVTPRYSDGSYPALIGHTPTMTSRDFNSGTNPDERGNRFTAPHTVNCHGARIYVRKASGSDFTVKLYDASNNVLASSAVTVNDQMGDASNQLYLPVFWTPVGLIGGQDYRLTVLATTANTLRISDLTFSSADARRAFGFEQYSTTRNDSGGSWTDDATAVALMSVLVEDYPNAPHPRFILGL